jgi:hypothetical protein
MKHQNAGPGREMLRKGQPTKNSIVRAVHAEPKSRMHDAHVEHSKVEGPSDRSFGLTVGIILVAIGLVRWLGFAASPGSSALIAGPGAVLILFGVAAPQVLAPLNRLWMKLGLLVSRIVNPLVMLLMFAFVFVPTALIMRLCGRDALRLRLDKSAPSYWIERQPAGPDPQSIIHQF